MLDSRSESHQQVCATKPLHGADRLKAQQEALRTAVENSLRESWNPAKFSLFLRLTGEVGRLGFLVEMGTGELFHEMGVWPEIEAFLVKGAQDEAVTPDQQIMALDALAFADIRANSDRGGIMARPNGGSDHSPRSGS